MSNIGVRGEASTPSQQENIANITALQPSSLGQFIIKTGSNTFSQSTALISLNGLSGSVQLIQMGSAGSDVSISSSGSSHTINVPDASDTKRGVITTGSQTFSGTKTFAQIASSALALTNGGITRANSAEIKEALHKFTWNSANVAGLSGTANTLTVCTLPAKTMVKRAWIIITGQAASVTALTVSLGRTTALFVDYLVASNAKAVANTVYGAVIGDIGTNLSGLVGDLPSITGTTDIKLRFDAALENLSLVTGSSGEIILETITLP